MEIVYRFCPTCAGRLESRSLKSGDPDRLVCTACGQILYLDPKVAVGTIIRTTDDRLVLVRRAIEPGYGLWVFPGGYVDRGEEVTGAAIREAREEAGLEVELDRLVNIYSYGRRSLIVIVYAARAVGGVLCTDEECLEARLFTPDAIPWDQLAFDSTT
nr:NUDIX hydrolase [Acidobacteriota bacterium]